MNEIEFNGKIMGSGNEVSEEVKGVLVIKINVGQLPVPKAEEFVKKVESGFARQIEMFQAQNIETMVFPVRTGETSVEYITF